MFPRGIIWVHILKTASQEEFLKNCPYFDICWPPVTFNDIWGQNDISYNTQEHHVILYPKNCSPGYILSNWPLFDLCLGLQWPLNPSKVKMTYPMILEWLIWVCSIKMRFLVEKLGLWLHFPFLPWLTSWPLVTSNFHWGQKYISYVTLGYHMSIIQKYASLDVFSKFDLILTFLSPVTSNYLRR